MPTVSDISPVELPGGMLSRRDGIVYFETGDAAGAALTEETCRMVADLIGDVRCPAIWSVARSFVVSDEQIALLTRSLRRHVASLALVGAQPTQLNDVRLYLAISRAPLPTAMFAGLEEAIDWSWAFLPQTGGDGSI